MKLNDATQSAIGLNPNPAIQPQPVAPKAPQVTKDQPTQPDGLQQIRQNYHTQMGALEGERGDIQKNQQEQLRAVKPVEMPQTDFKPLTHSMSSFSALLMVVGALAGRKTMQPMTAALNNMTGVMKGLKEGDQQLYDMHKAEFERNYKVGMDKYNAFIEKRREIIMDAKGDMAVVNQKMLDLYRESGMDIKTQQAMEHGMHDTSKLALEQQKQMDNMKLQLKKLEDQKGWHKNQQGGEHERKVMEAVNKLEVERDKELTKTSEPEKVAEINARFNRQIADARGSAAAAPNAGGKPIPTPEDIAYAKSHPETKAQFVAHFGREP